MATGHEAAAQHAPTASEYIVHHLTHLNTSGHAQNVIVDWGLFNLDTLFWSILLGVLGMFLFARVASKATSGVPGRLQAAVEIIIEMVNTQAKGIVHNAESRKFVAPLALTAFVWIFLMNAMDLVPLDLLPLAWQTATGNEHAYMRVVPTADLNGTLSLSIGVLIISLYYNLKIKGIGGWTHELLTAPFGSHPLLMPANLALNLIEYVAKTVSHGMRLFGNLYAGELIFMLIALMGASLSASFTGVSLFAGHLIAGTAWAIFHILIIVLQAFIFMMLTLVYIGQAHESH
ncbi:MAG: F0F1 ATP synthase subunit A [Sterolibacteriaceae bacterium]|jgi:F-type H+-transporting ATPase subunit a|uniref:ATP synthase subunit a n=1 Tax=Candidatus Methylophosphatis roskildensis TaxID=2899263 RepID=A0A9D7E1H1_9PROT|nr:F0F1 ATP synthase subunit A [Candidatus Methylophosphatis roskildensis]MBK7662796.1 F0F1 ATP synthase subunit A [Sterolibacteriaceae bacterium]MBK9086908.1 F0F1 ATP synthase subunit A [Sterolibacteriaceae bacterium]